MASNVTSRGRRVSGREADRRRIAGMQQALLAWYAEEARDLPWRRTSDPYAILVSEVMLQQTRVETALAYYDRFLKRFPTIERLAASTIDDVLKAWEGLGYYRRAQNLHRAAAALVADHGGAFPKTAEALAELPGIGPYTAAAVASIAWGADVPALDGNVVRVLSRVFRIPGDPQRAETRTKLRRTAERFLRRGEASSFNQALMDLGARTCSPRNPCCDACPLRAGCEAHRDGRERDFPQRAPRKSIPHVEVAAGIVWESMPWDPNARLLIAQRKLDDMLGGLWEFPGGGVEPGESEAEALVRELDEELAIRVSVLEPFMEVEHAYTHFRVTLHFFHCRHESGEPRAVDCAAWRWVHPHDLDDYAFPAADRRVLTALQRGRGLDRAPVSRSREQRRAPTKGAHLRHPDSDSGESL